MKKILTTLLFLIPLTILAEINGNMKLIFSQEGTAYFDTESFKLKAGTAVFKASVENSEPITGSFSSFSLCRIDNGKSVCYGMIGNDLTIKTKEGESKATGKTTVRSLTGGEYYIRVISGIDWSVEIYQ